MNEFGIKGLGGGRVSGFMGLELWGDLKAFFFAFLFVWMGGWFMGGWMDGWISVSWMSNVHVPRLCVP